MFAFEVHCTEQGCYPHTNGVIGGGLENKGCFDEHHEKLDLEWSKHHPMHEVHVEEISIEQYLDERFGAIPGGRS